MAPTTAPRKITITKNHWRVPSVERAFDGRVAGDPSEEERCQRIDKVLKERANWKAGKGAIQLLEQLMMYVGCRVRLQLWDPIMLMLDDEGPRPLEADFNDVVLLKDGEFLQAYIVIDSLREIASTKGASALRCLVNRAGIEGQLVPLYEINEIWPVGDKKSTALLAAALATGGTGEAENGAGSQLSFQESFVAGLPYYEFDSVCSQISLGDEVRLVRKPENAHDVYAVEVWWKSHMLGHIPRDENISISNLMDAGRQLVARVSTPCPEGPYWSGLGIHISTKR